MNRMTRLVAGVVLVVAAPISYVLLEPRKLEHACGSGVAWGTGTPDVTNLFVAGGVAMVALMFLVSCLLFPAAPRARPEDTHAM